MRIILRLQLLPYSSSSSNFFCCFFCRVQRGIFEINVHGRKQGRPNTWHIFCRNLCSSILSSHITLWLGAIIFAIMSRMIFDILRDGAGFAGVNIGVGRIQARR